MTRRAVRLGLLLFVWALCTPARAQTYTHYDCDGGTSFELMLFSGTKAAFLQLDGKSIKLPQSLSVTGTRYRGSGITVWAKGDRATLRRAGKRIECKLK